MRGFTIHAHQGIGLISAILMIGAAIALLFFGHNIEPVKRQCMWLALPLIPLMSLGALRGAMLRGLRLVVLGQLPERVIRPGGLVVAILIILAFGREYLTPPAVMIGQLAATTIAFAWGLSAFIRRRPIEATTAEPQFRTRDWIRSSIPFGLSATLLLINGRTDVIALGLFREDAEVGVYRVAVQMAATIIFSQAAVNAIQGPHIAHLYATGDMKRLQIMITRSSQAILAVAATVRARNRTAGPLPDPLPLRSALRGCLCPACNPVGRTACECGDGIGQFAAQHDWPRARDDSYPPGCSFPKSGAKFRSYTYLGDERRCRCDCIHINLLEPHNVAGCLQAPRNPCLAFFARRSIGPAFRRDGDDQAHT